MRPDRSTRRWRMGRTILRGSRPGGSTRIAVAEGLANYVWLEEAGVTG